MSIEVARVSEGMAVEEIVHDANELLASIVANSWSKLTESKTLQFIDPWGDTIFNQAQIPVLRAEIEEFGATLASVAAREHLGQVLKLVARAEGQMHTYIKFIGD